MNPTTRYARLFWTGLATVVGVLLIPFGIVVLSHPGEDQHSGIVWLVGGVAIGGLSIWAFVRTWREHPGGSMNKRR
jgi:hypothetical protein